MSLTLRNARLMDGRLVDIAIAGEHIEALAPRLPGMGAIELDAGGRLTLPAFVNGQLHACKSFWRRGLAHLPAEVRNLPRFQAAAHVKRAYTEDDVARRVDEAMRLAVANGTCAIRLFADVDDDAGLVALRALLRVKRDYARLMRVQAVAFPQDGVSSATTPRLLDEGLRAGADVVGGIPFIEKGVDAQQRHVAMCFDLAREHDKDLHFVVDDVGDVESRTLEMIARAAIARGWHGRVACTQCAALSFYPDDVARNAIALVKDAGITIFANSHVSLIATDFDHARHPWPRGVTRIRDLLAAGVPIACAQDDIDNWFYPFGRNDLLEVAHYMAHQGQFAWGGEVERVLPMVTDVPAGALGLTDYGLRPGAEANIVVLDGPDWHHAVQHQSDKRYVVLRGALVAETERRVSLRF